MGTWRNADAKSSTGRADACVGAVGLLVCGRDNCGPGDGSAGVAVAASTLSRLGSAPGVDGVPLNSALRRNSRSKACCRVVTLRLAMHSRRSLATFGRVWPVTVSSAMTPASGRRARPATHVTACVTACMDPEMPVASRCRLRWLWVLAWARQSPLSHRVVAPRVLWEAMAPREVCRSLRALHRAAAPRVPPGPALMAVVAVRLALAPVVLVVVPKSCLPSTL